MKYFDVREQNDCSVNSISRKKFTLIKSTALILILCCGKRKFKMMADSLFSSLP